MARFKAAHLHATEANWRTDRDLFFVGVLSSSARGVLGADLTAQVASTDSFVVRQLTVPLLGRTSVGTQDAFLPGLERRLWGTLP